MSTGNIHQDLVKDLAEISQGSCKFLEGTYKIYEHILEDTRNDLGNISQRSWQTLQDLSSNLANLARSLEYLGKSWLCLSSIMANLAKSLEYLGKPCKISRVSLQTLQDISSIFANLARSLEYLGKSWLYLSSIMAFKYMYFMQKG